MSRVHRPHRTPRPLSARVCAGIAGWLGLVLACGALSADARPRSVSGIYPHLAMFSDSGECGTGAVVLWAGRLWVVTYSPHEPLGSPDQLYEITPDLRRVARPESIGGTPANRMIHRESGQLFIGPYAIDAQRRVYRIRPEPLREIDDWLQPFRKYWSAHVDALERHLDRMEARKAQAKGQGKGER